MHWTLHSWEMLPGALPLKLEAKWFCFTVLSFAIKQKRLTYSNCWINYRYPCHGEQLIKNCLHHFIMNEKRKYGHNSNSVPIWFTCDMSWPMKLLLSVHKTDCFEIHFQYLAKKVEELGKIKDRINYLIDNDSLKLECNSFKTNLSARIWQYWFPGGRYYQ